MDKKMKPCLFCGEDDEQGFALDPKFWKDGNGNTGPGCCTCGSTAPTVDIWNDAPIRDELTRLRERITKLEGALREISKLKNTDPGQMRWVARTALKEDEG